MASVRQDKVQVVLEIEGNQARVELDNLERKQKVINDELKLMKKGTDEYVQKSKELKGVTSDIEAMRGKLGTAGMSMQQLQKHSRELFRDLQRLTPGTDSFVQKSAELKKVDDRLAEVRRQARGIGDELEKTGGGFSDFAKKALAFTGIQMGAEAVVESVMDAGRAMVETVQEFQKMRSEISLLTGESGQQLDDLTTSIRTVSQTFGKDYNEVLISSNALSKQMGISQQEAIKLIEQGFLAGADASGEFLDQLREYPTHFKDAEMSAEEMVAVITQSTKEGVFSDKGADVVKEFGLRIREQTSATKDALDNAFGEEFTQKLFDNLNNGSITTTDALKLISQGLDDTSLTAAQTQLVIADVFGGPGEDAGLDYLKSLQNIGSSMDGLIDTSNVYVQRQQALLASERELAEAQNELSKSFDGGNSSIQVLTNQSLTFLYTLLTGLLTVFIDMFSPLSKVWNSLERLAVSAGLVGENSSIAKSAAEGLVTVFNALTMPLQLTYQFMSWVVSGLIDLATSSPVAMQNLRGLVSVVRSFFTALENAPAYLAGFGEAIKQTFSNVGDMISAALSGDWDAVESQFDNFGTSVSKAFNLAYDLEMHKADAMRQAEADAQAAQEAAQAAEEAKIVAEGIAAEEKKARAKAAAEALKEKQKQLEEQHKQELEATKAIEDLRNELIENEFARKIAILQTNAEREKAAAQGTDEQIAEQRRLIENRLTADIAAVEKERADQRLKLAQDTARAEQELRNRYTAASSNLSVLQAEEALKTAALTAGISGRMDIQRQAEDALLSARQQSLDAQFEMERQAAEQQYQDKLQQDIANLQLSGEELHLYEVEAFAAYLSEKELMEAEHLARRNELNIQHAEQRGADERAKDAENIGHMQNAVGTFFDFKKIASDREMAKLEKDKQRRLGSLEAEYKAGKISKEQYENSKNSIETNYDAKARSIKRKAAEDEKKARIADSIMAGLLAVIKAAPNIPLQIATGIMAALNTAKIIATPVPTFGKGGAFSMLGGALKSIGSSVKRMFSKGGINSTAGVPSVGQTHSNGGIKMIDGASGEYLGEWERGEPYMILSRNTYANNKPIIDSLLDSSLYRNGAPIKMKKGGIYAADGALVGGAAPGAPASGGESFDVLVSEVRGLRQDIQALPKNQKAYVVYSEIEDAGAELNQVRADASA